MSKQRILLDSNSYFRLARTIHPLLGQSFGESQYVLKVIKELDDEYSRSSRLQGKFSWVEDQAFRLNRQHNRVGYGSKKAAINIAEGVIKRHCASKGLFLSSVDVLCLAYGHVLSITVVTDDEPMLQAAADFAIGTMKSVELMLLMRRCRHISEPEVRSVARSLAANRDFPKNFVREYEELFGKEFPWPRKR